MPCLRIRDRKNIAKLFWRGKVFYFEILSPDLVAEIQSYFATRLGLFVFKSLFAWKQFLRKCRTRVASLSPWTKDLRELLSLEPEALRRATRLITVNKTDKSHPSKNSGHSALRASGSNETLQLSKFKTTLALSED